jgi:hypothetical protein
MKKSILIVLLVAFLAVAVGVSGCLDNNDPANNSTNNTPGNNTSNNTTNVTFDENIVKVSPVPTGFELLAVKSNVTADTERIDGLTDALVGYSATYQYNNSSLNGVYLFAFQCNNSTDAAGYVQKMIDAHNTKYPNSSNVTTVQVNNHNATLLTTNTQSPSGNASYELAWASNEYLVVVNGPAAYNLISAIADASKL